MAVKIVRNSIFDISKSLLMEDDELRERAIELAERYDSALSGAVALDEDAKVYPLVTGFINRRLSLSKPISFDTAMTYASNLIYLVNYLKKDVPVFNGSNRDDCLLSVTGTTIEMYLNHLRKKEKKSSQTIRNRDATYLAFFNTYLCEVLGSKAPIREDNPYENGKFKSAAPSKQLIEMCTVNELEALILCAKNERERALLQFIFDSGVRRSELSRISKADIDQARAGTKDIYIVDDHTVSVPSDYGRIRIHGSKGRGQELQTRNTIVSKATLLRVSKYHSTPLYKKHARKFGKDKPAFLNAAGNEWTAVAITQLLTKLSRRAIKLGILKRRVSPHKLRHGYAVITMRSTDLGKDSIGRLLLIKSALGHKHLTTTEIYQALPYETYDQLVDKLSGEAIYRYQIMEKLYKKSKLKVGLKDVK